MPRPFLFSRLDLTYIVAFTMFIVAGFFSPKIIHENYLLVLVPGIILLPLSLYYIIEAKKYIVETVNNEEVFIEEHNNRNHFFVGIICLVISIGLILNSIWIATSSLYLMFLTKKFFVKK